MIVKDIYFENTARTKLMSGIDKIADAVKSTLGARGRTVLIESEHHVGGLTVTKDGVTVARSITLLDPTENLAVQMMRQAAANTATTAGDGTTTAIVLTQAMIHAAEDYISEGINTTEVLREVKRMSADIIATLQRRAVKVTDKNLLNVATISANGDTDIGTLIYDAHKAVGDDGVVTVENSKSTETYCDVTTGLKVDRGYTSRYFITDEKMQECVLEKPYIFLSDQEVSSLNSYEAMLKPIIQGGRSILFICPMGGNALSTLTVNKVKGTIKTCAIIPPSFGYRTDDLMGDLAVLTGGRYLSEKLGDDATLVNLSDLGTASRAVIGSGSTVLVTDPEDTSAIDRRIADVREMLADETNAEAKQFLQERLALLCGGVAVISVGAQSDIEQKEKKDRVDDAVCATKAAIEGGILPGGGIALLEAAKEFDEKFVKAYKKRPTSNESVIAKDILVAGLISPFEQININGGFDPEDIVQGLERKGMGFDVAREKFGSMVSMGIIDPAKVTITALENAVSVATTILSTNAIITNVRDI